MRERNSEKRAPVPSQAPWHVPVTVEDIAETGQHFALVADEETRANIARLAGLRDLPRLQADFDVTRQGAGGVRVSGRVSATVGQNCVVTLEPLANEIDEEVDLLFMPQSAAAAGSDGGADDDEADAKWDDREPLIDGVVDLGALATEFLVLGIDPYPRKPGAVFESPANSGPEEGPFAGLAGWTKGRGDG
jgi:Large ribosomal RNA subunit accumulation protein YceD